MKNSRKKNLSNQLGLGFILWLVIFASLVCGAGVGMQIIKNKQVSVRREMENMRVEINSCEKTTDYYKEKIASNTSRWEIRDRLAQNKSELQEIKPEQLELIQSGYTAEAVAAAK